MDGPLTIDELASIMQSCAGIGVDTWRLQDRPGTTFEDLGLDSLGLLGVVAEVENRYGAPLGPDLERSRSPQEFVDLANAQMTSGV